MILSLKYKRYAIAIALLLLVLGFKYIVVIGNSLESPHPDSDLSLEGYIIHADNGASVTSVKDIFAEIHGRELQANRINRPIPIKPNISKSKRETPTINNTKEQPAVTDGEFERIKLLGIVFHDNKKKAYMALDRRRLIADVGDIVYGRYLLRDIAVNSAELVDTKENQQKTILVSGK
jgi:hypothetical protein